MLTRTVNVTLVVNGDFSISATPASITINRGGTAVYTVTITAGTGFSGTVALSVSNAPGRATVTVNPTSVVNSGTSTLTIATQANVQRRTHADDHGNGRRAHAFDDGDADHSVDGITACSSRAELFFGT